MRLRSSANRPADADTPYSTAGWPEGSPLGEGLRLLRPGEASVSPLVVAAYSTDDPYVLQVRAIRAKVVAARKADRLGLRQNVLGVIGVGQGDEAAVLSANLAVIYAQLDTMTALIDCGLSDPVIASLMGVADQPGVSESLSSPTMPVSAQSTALSRLVVVPAGLPDAAAKTYLEKNSLVEVIDRWALPGVEQLIVALPDIGSSSSSLGNIVAGFDGVILVSKKGETPIDKVRALIDALDERKVQVVGSVIC